jgi:hypothetical protein
LLGKVPGEYLGDGLWRGFGRFTQHIATDADIAKWDSWPGVGVGLLARNHPAVDIDVTDPDLADKIHKLAVEMLRLAPCRTGNAPKRLLMYRGTPMRKRRLQYETGGAVEILGNGQQYVVDGTHPKTEKRYVWDIDPISFAEIGLLVEITEAQIEAFLDACAELAPVKSKSGAKGPEVREAHGGIAAADLASLPEALLSLANEAIDRELSTHGKPEIGQGSDDRAYRLGAALGDLAVDSQRFSALAAATLMHQRWAPDFDLSWLYEKARNAIDKYRQNGVGCNAPAETFNKFVTPDLKEPAAKTDAPRVMVLRGSQFVPKKIEWLWKNWLALGKFHILAGPKGAGKSTLNFSLMATVSVGGLWPDGSKASIGDCLVWSGEDDFQDTILPRFLVAGGNPERLHCVGRIVGADGRRPFDIGRDIPLLREAVREIPELRFIHIDPIVMAVTGDSHKNAETRRGLQPIVDLAEQSRTALVGITHFTKGTDGKEPVERVTGSLAFGALARVVLAASADEDGNRRRFVRAASNVGPSGGGFEYSLSQEPLAGHDMEAQRVLWGEQLRGSARELLEMVRGATLRESAEAFLTDMLRDGAVPVKDIQAAANANGHSWRTIERAKQGMPHIKACKGQVYDGRSPIWHWTDTSQASFIASDEVAKRSKKSATI